MTLRLSVFLCLLRLAIASLSFTDPVPIPLQILQTHGSASTTVHFLLEISSDEQVISPSVILPSSSRPVVTSHSIFLSEVDSNAHNVTLELEFDGWVGKESLSVEVSIKTSDGTRKETIDLSVDVLGVTLFEVDGDTENIISGDDGTRLKYDSYLEGLLPARTLQIVTNGGDKNGISFSIRDYEGREDGFLGSDSVKLNDEGLVSITPREYLVGSGLAIVDFTLEDLAFDGEVFESAFILEMGRTPNPPPLVQTKGNIEGVLSGDQIVFDLIIYNIETIPKVWVEVNGTHFEGLVNGNSVKFSGKALSTGIYDAIVLAESGEGSVDVVMTGGLELKVGSSTIDSVPEKEVNGFLGIGLLVGGVVAAAVVILTVLGVMFARWSRLTMESNEQSFTSGVGGVPYETDPVFVARDIYGRGSINLQDV